MKTIRLLMIISVAALLCVTLAQAAARKNAAAAKPTAHRASDTIATDLEIKGVPDTEIQTTPSVSPSRESEGAPAWEGSAPLSAPEDAMRPDANVTETAQSLSVDAAAYLIDWYSINGGGVTDASSASYRMGASVGQTVAGEATSSNYRLGIGFWYGASGSAGGCACDCHGDPGGPCDGFTNILDVAQVVNAAFRNFPPMLDPNASCPYETSDVNCSGSAEVIDVVKMVNVAFRNGNPATEFCNPCAP